ncbi:MAG: outer membrane lipoprotein carrier protein LolA [Alphaproteobacteria bacterium]
MNRRIAGLAVIVLVLGLMLSGRAAGATAVADAETIARVESYMNALTTLRARFVQVAQDGGVSEGTLYMMRPGRLRIEYAPPSQVLMVADGVMLTYVDREIGQISQMPLSETPAGVLVGEKLRLSGDITVSEITHDAAIVRVTLTRTRDPDAGALTLVFTEKPFDLRQWIVVDPQGFSTRVTLFDARRGLPLNPALFATPAPIPSADEGR